MITLVSGTNRKNSVTRQIVSVYQSILSSHGVESYIIDLEKLPSDFIATALYENSGKNRLFNPMREQMLHAEKFVFFIPEYNGSFPGVLKTFIDGLAYPDTFEGKKCALVGISSGIQGAILAMSHLTDVFNHAKMHVLAQKPKLLNIENHLKDGEIENNFYKQLLKEQIESFLQF